MTNNSDSSYRRYRQYRDNRRQYEMNQIAAPIVMLLIIGVLTNYWWIVVIFASIVLMKRVLRTVPQSEHKQSDIIERRMVMTDKSTDTGYVNKNNQKNLGKTNKPGTDNNQWFYKLECQECGHTYYANGTDIWQRKCPNCQGGQE